MQPACSPGCPEYHALSRRNFLTVAGGAVAVAAAAPAWLPRVAMARDHRSATRDVIVSIYLRGAADGMSLVPPHAEDAYYSARPTLAIPRPDSGSSNAATDLDGFFGLAPSMTPLMQAYQDGKCLFVHACGSTDPSRSHFDAQRFMEVGLPNDPSVATGWLGRHLATIDPLDPSAFLLAVGISSGLQRTLVGSLLTLPIPNLDNFGITGAGSSLAARTAALGAMYESAEATIQASAISTVNTIDLLNTIDFAGYVPAGGAAYPSVGATAASFGTALKSSAALIKAQVGVEAIAIDLGGWDTHNNQGNFDAGFLATLMRALSEGLAAFYTDMTAEAAPTFTLVCMSEFGRRLTQNASQGTDHGHANAMIVMGNAVSGGRVLANWPGLAPENLFQGIDLEVTIDYRDVLAEIVQQRLGNANLAAVFPTFTPTFRGVLA